jgi:hypothetical protein
MMARSFSPRSTASRAPILYENLKSVVLDRAGDHVRFTSRCASRPGTTTSPRSPARPTAGTRRARSSGRSSTCATASSPPGGSHARKVPGDPAGRLVHAALEEEQPRLLALPEHPWNSDLVKPVASGKQPYIRFDRNDDSIPHWLAGKPLSLVASEDLVRITTTRSRSSRTPPTSRNSLARSAAPTSCAAATASGLLPERRRVHRGAGAPRRASRRTGLPPAEAPRPVRQGRGRGRPQERARARRRRRRVRRARPRPARPRPFARRSSMWSFPPTRACASSASPRTPSPPTTRSRSQRRTREP